MLEPSRDRLNYSTMFRPPDEGFKLEYAVACTYSLDLSALLSAILPLGFDGDAKGICRNNPVFMLFSLNKLLSKLQVFCDAASISVPNLQHNKLLVLLDKIVFPVKHQTAFHPKFWLLKFERKGEYRYRLAVLSKNITFDRSWDVVMFFDGQKKDTLSNGAPLADILEYLKKSQRGKGNRLQELSVLANEIKYVEFFNEDVNPEDLLILPFGLKPDVVTQDEFLLKRNAKFYRLLVMSPFLSSNDASDFFNRGREGAEKILFTRKSALASFSQNQLSNIQCYCVKDEVVFGEQTEFLESSPEQPQPEDIHAKIYIFQCYQNNTPYLYIGSANLTSNGMKNKNIELLVRVKLHRNNVYDIIRNDLLPENRNGVFELCEEIPVADKSEEEIELDKLKRQFRKFTNDLKKISASVDVEKQNDLYIVTLHCQENIKCECKVEIAPFAGKFHEFSSKITFAPQTVETISDFYRVRLSSKNVKLEKLMIIETMSLLNLRNARQESIEAKCLDNSANILEYLSYILSEDAYVLAMQKKELCKSNSSSLSDASNQFALYEKLLYWAATDKKRLLEIREVICQRHIDTSEETKKLLALCEIFYHASGGNK